MTTAFGCPICNNYFKVSYTKIYSNLLGITREGLKVYLEIKTTKKENNNRLFVESEVQSNYMQIAMEFIQLTVIHSFYWY